MAATKITGPVDWLSSERSDISGDVMGAGPHKKVCLAKPGLEGYAPPFNNSGPAARADAARPFGLAASSADGGSTNNELS